MSRDLSRVPSAPPTTPGPEAPVILTPNEQGGQGRAPYDSFLCHSPPANTWIAVETLESEYSLLVRLPGFTRNGMLVFFLSLPVFFIDPPPVAPSPQRGVAYYMLWLIRGSLKAVRRTVSITAPPVTLYLGHFERRVSFGYDAELSQVRAEFDGEMLRIVVPRRISAVTSS